MISLKNLLKEESFTAINKDSGEVSVFKTKDARDSAIKAGTHDKQDSKSAKGGDSPTDKKDVPKVNIFNKDKEEPKKDSGRPKDSTGGRAGNPEVNKAVRKKAQSLGITPKKLGKEGSKDSINLIFEPKLF